jgi:hypothetical protein
VFILWLGSTLVAAVYFINSRLVPFDPNIKLLRQEGSVVMQYTVIQQVREITALKNLKNTVVHFTSNDCSCTQYSEEHKAAINEKARLDGFNILNINLPADLSTVIPSTPAILIIDDLDELLYFGPYSVGLACSASNGYVETVLQNYAQGHNSNLVISDVKGCYCNI